MEDDSPKRIKQGYNEILKNEYISSSPHAQLKNFLQGMTKMKYQRKDKMSNCIKIHLEQSVGGQQKSGINQLNQKLKFNW